MSRALRRLLGAAGLALGAFAIVFFVGMRTKSPVVLDAVRRFNRAVTNPRVMKSAGTPGASASVIRHVGRRSGRRYETPVGAMPVEGGYLIALPYGRRSDWFKNVCARGSATIVDAGQEVEVERPEVVRTADVAGEFPPGELRTLRAFRVDECLRVRRLVTAGASSSTSGTTGPTDPD